MDHTWTVTKPVRGRSWYALNDFHEQVKESESVGHTDNNDNGNDNDNDNGTTEEAIFANPLGIGAIERRCRGLRKPCVKKEMCADDLEWRVAEKGSVQYAS